MNSGVRLRPARAQDLPEIANIIAQAMLEDELFTWMCPGRHEYYADFRYGFLRRLKTRFVTPGYVMIVAVEHSGDREEIRGYSGWVRYGTGADAVQWKRANNGWWHGALERTLLDLEDRYFSLVFPDRSKDLDRLQQFRTAADDTFPFADFPELWYLGQLAIDPPHQRRGIGKQLVEWGLQQAKREHVCVGLEAGIKGAGLYKKLGFDIVNMTNLTPGVDVRAMMYTI